MAKQVDRPEGLNVGGRFSYANLTAQEAYDSAHRADSKLPPKQRPQSVDEAKASFNVLLNEAGLEVVKNYLLDTVIPWFEQEVADGNKKMTVDQQGINLIRDNIVGEVWDAKLGTLAIKPVNEKTQALAPTAAASLVVKAWKAGTNISKEAFVTEEEQLLTKPFTKKQMFPLEDTIFDLYPGCYVKATISFWIGAVNGAPYLSCAGSSVAFWKDAPSFVGGGSDTEGMIAAGDDMFID